jgi:gas vesicle structural protein
MFSEESLLQNQKEEAEGSALAALIRSDIERVSLCEILDRILNKGAVVAGEVTISVADVDLISLDLRMLLTSVATHSKKRQPESITVVGDK